MSFATAINCLDGRVQLPLIQWMRAAYGLDFVDLITEPGPDKLLSMGSPEQLDALRSKVLISLSAHGSKLVVIAGHHDCLGNPVSRDYHLEQIRKAVSVLRSWSLPATIIGVWINPDWQVEVVEGG